MQLSDYNEIMSTESKTKLNMAMFLMVVLLAANMRMTYTGIGALVPIIRTDLGMSATAAGMISTVPILVFAFICPLSSIVGRRVGIGRMIEAGLILIFAGSVLRAVLGTFGLFAGTIVLSVGVGVMNALMMALIKLRFPHKPGIMTSAYTTTMAVTAAISIGANVPIANQIGWRGCLALWGLVSLVTSFVWGRQANAHENNGSAGAGQGSPMIKVIKSPKAWALLIFMGTQSMMFYNITAWLPTILISRGMDHEAAAGIATMLQIVSLPSTLLSPILAEKLNRIALCTALNLTFTIGGVIFYFSGVNTLMYFAVVLMAVGMGSGFSLCSFLFSKHARNPAETAAISGFSQSGGYILAAIGPAFMGHLFDTTGSWNPAMIFCFIILIVMTVSGAVSNLDGFIIKE